MRASWQWPAPCSQYKPSRWITYVQRFSAVDGSPMATQILSGTKLSASAMDVAPDGRVLLAGDSALPDVPLTTGVVFSDAVKQRTASGSFLAAFDLATAAMGGRLACVADGMTSQPVGPVAPGQLITLYGAGLGPAPGIASSISGPGPAATSLGGVTVTFDGVPAPLAYAGANQINASVPFEVAANASTLMKIIVNGSVIAWRQFAVAPSSPGLFIDASSDFNQVCGNVGGCVFGGGLECRWHPELLRQPGQDRLHGHCLPERIGPLPR
jgi:hypothetical protein